MKRKLKSGIARLRRNLLFYLVGKSPDISVLSNVRFQPGQAIQPFKGNVTLVHSCHFESGEAGGDGIQFGVAERPTDR